MGPGGLRGHRQPRRRLPQLVRYYRGLALDEFQTQAILRLDQQTSTLVCAPTGTGKTLIADYLVEKTLHAGQRLIYTGPIKALVNQKFREFSWRFGRARVGILTGDISFQPEAPLLLMTTEVLRNMLLRQQPGLNGPDDPEGRLGSHGTGRHPRLDSLAWVIFDEIHYLGHPERGTVWEEAILLLPRGVRLLGLSATIANARELADWLRAARDEPCALVVSRERSVPLVHRYFNRDSGAVDLPGLLRAFIEGYRPDLAELEWKKEPGAGNGGPQFDWRDTVELLAHRLRTHPRRGGGTAEPRRTGHLDLIRYVQHEHLFPTLYFVFSRRGTEERAAELARIRDFLRPIEKETVRVTVKQTLEQQGLRPAQIPDLPGLMELWRRGIAFHHAGLLPAVKRIVENLLERRVLRVVYATETFAVGVNMPVRSVCFDALEKHVDGRLRLLDRHEYLQMAGRAGRRGLDRVGTVISRVDFSDLERWLTSYDGEDLLLATDWTREQPEPILSQLRLSFNLVLNLTLERGVAGVETLLRRSLGVYQSERDRQEQEESEAPVWRRLVDDYRSRLQLLAVLNHIALSSVPPLTETPAPPGVSPGEVPAAPGGPANPGPVGLLPRGEISRNLYVRELLVAELLYEGLPQRLSPPELAGLAAALVYDEGEAEVRLGLRIPLSPPRWWGEVSALADRLRRAAFTARLPLAETELAVQVAVAPPVQAWAAGAPLAQVLQEFDLEPGDFVSLCRQTIDLLRQMAGALPDDQALQSRVEAALTGLDRDVVQVRL